MLKQRNGTGGGIPEIPGTSAPRTQRAAPVPPAWPRPGQSSAALPLSGAGENPRAGTAGADPVEEGKGLWGGGGIAGHGSRTGRAGDSGRIKV